MFARNSRLNEIQGIVKIVGSSDDSSSQKSPGTDTEVVYGCRLSDFQGDFNGRIAVLFRGACKFEEKVKNAAKVNASAIVVINNNPEGVITMSIGGKEHEVTNKLKLT